MLKAISKINKKGTGIFAAGVLFGTAGIKILSSKDAKKLYTNCTAAILRAKDCVMKTATTVQENAEDIYEGAKAINREREEAETVYGEGDEDSIGEKEAVKDDADSAEAEKVDSFDEQEQVNP